jgi:hypothetical protein
MNTKGSWAWSWHLGFTPPLGQLPQPKKIPSLLSFVDFVLFVVRFYLTTKGTMNTKGSWAWSWHLGFTPPLGQHPQPKKSPLFFPSWFIFKALQMA